MSQLVIAVLMKMRDKFPELSLWDSLLKEYSRDAKSSESWVKKTGINEQSMSELFNKLSPSTRLELFNKVVKALYHAAVINKHPKAEAYLFKVPGMESFIYDVNKRLVFMKAFPEDRAYRDYDFFKQLPRIKEFIKYLNNYSKRRKRFQ